MNCSAARPTQQNMLAGVSRAATRQLQESIVVDGRLIHGNAAAWQMGGTPKSTLNSCCAHQYDRHQQTPASLLLLLLALLHEWLLMGDD
jgi:hypothetical protein